MFVILLHFSEFCVYPWELVAWAGEGALGRLWRLQRGCGEVPTVLGHHILHEYLTSYLIYLPTSNMNQNYGLAIGCGIISLGRIISDAVDPIWHRSDTIPTPFHYRDF